MKALGWGIGLVALFGCAKIESPGQTPVPSTPVLQGTTSSGGGGAYEIEFKDIGRTVVRRWNARNIPTISGVTDSEFETALNALTVDTTEEPLKKDDEPVDALNFPEQMRVLLSLVHWAPYMDFSQKRRLVVHEVLGLMGKEGSKSYEVTDQILATIGLFDELDIYDFQVGWEVAKILTEKMPWFPEEISVDNTYKSSRTTFYRTRVEQGGHYIACRKIETLFPGDESSAYFCMIGGQAFVSDEGTVILKLNGVHPLWRLFDQSEYETPGLKFDYGVVQGHYRGLASYLTFFP